MELFHSCFAVVLYYVCVCVCVQGSTQKTYVQSELVAVGVAGLVAYYAYSTRQSLMSSS